MRKLVRYVIHRPTWQKLPMLPRRQYSVDYDPHSVDPDTSTLMSLTHVRSPQGVDLLKRRHRKRTARELIDSLPARRRPRRLKSRVMSLLRRALGLMSYDPMLEIARRHIRRR